MGGEQGVPAEVGEEVRLGRQFGGRNGERRRPGVAHPRLPLVADSGRGGRGSRTAGRGEPATGGPRQPGAVGLAAGRHRQPVQEVECRRDHVGGQGTPQAIGQARGKLLVSGSPPVRRPDDVGGEQGLSGAAVARSCRAVPPVCRAAGHARAALPWHERRGRLCDTGVLQQDVVDLLQRHPVAADLHLRVDPAQILDLPVRGQPAEVPGAVQAAVPGREGVPDEAVRGQVRASHVSAGEPRPAEADLPDVARRHGPEPLVEQDGRVRRQWPADRHRAARPEFLTGRGDGRLRRPVRVEQAPPRPAPPLHQRGRARLTADEHAAQARHITREGRQQRRHAVQNSHPVPVQELGEIGPQSSRSDRPGDERGTGRPGGPDLLDREVEGDRHALVHAVRGPDAVHAGDHAKKRADARPGDLHALGPAAGPGGVHHVGQRVRCAARQGLGPRGREPRQAGGACVDLDDPAGPAGHRPGFRRGPGRLGGTARKGGRGQHDGGSGIAQDETDPVGRCRRVDRHERRTRLAHTQQARVHLDGSGQQQRHAAVRAHAQTPQVVGHPVRPGVQFGVRHPPVVALDGHGPGRAVTGVLEEPVRSVTASGRTEHAVPARGGRRSGDAGGHVVPLGCVDHGLCGARSRRTVLGVPCRIPEGSRAGFP